MISKDALLWLTPILAALTFLLDGGHMVGLIKPEILVLIGAGVTAIVGFLAAIKKPEEQLPAPQTNPSQQSGQMQQPSQPLRPGGPQK